jgi:hypothetical protein
MVVGAGADVEKGVAMVGAEVMGRLPAAEVGRAAAMPPPPAQHAPTSTSVLVNYDNGPMTPAIVVVPTALPLTAGNGSYAPQYSVEVQRSQRMMNRRCLISLVSALLLYVALIAVSGIIARFSLSLVSAQSPAPSSSCIDLT